MRNAYFKGRISGNIIHITEEIFLLWKKHFFYHKYTPDLFSLTNRNKAQ